MATASTSPQVKRIFEDINPINQGNVGIMNHLHVALTEAPASALVSSGSVAPYVQETVLNEGDLIYVTIGSNPVSARKWYMVKGDSLVEYFDGAFFKSVSNSGGSTSLSFNVPGVISGSPVLASIQSEANAANIQSVSSSSNDTVDVTFSADPGSVTVAFAYAPGQ